MTLSAQQQIVDALARSVGAIIDWERIADPHQYDGKTLAGKGVSLASIIHDIAHFIIAPPSRRRLPDFGLGSSPDSFALSTRRVVSSDWADREERAASVFGILLERSLGFDWTETLEDHGWDLKTWRQAALWVSKQLRDGRCAVPKSGMFMPNP